MIKSEGIKRYFSCCLKTTTTLVIILSVLCWAVYFILVPLISVESTGPRGRNRPEEREDAKKMDNIELKMLYNVT